MGSMSAVLAQVPATTPAPRLKVEHRGHVMVLTLDDAATRNALHGGAWLLPRVIGYPRAARLAFTGEMIGAEEALKLGLVSEVVEGR